MPRSLTPHVLRPLSQMNPLLEDVGMRGPNTLILQLDSTFPWLLGGSYEEPTSGLTGLYDPEWETRSRFLKRKEQNEKNIRES